MFLFLSVGEHPAPQGAAESWSVCVCVCVCVCVVSAKDCVVMSLCNYKLTNGNGPV